MEIWLATSNQGKIREFEKLLGPLGLEIPGLEIKSPKDLTTYSSPKEDGDSFLANARLKARSLKALKPGTWIIGEDSGLEVDGLGGLPGIHSARYAGDNAKDVENCLKVLKMLYIRRAENRSAQFRSTLVVYDPKGTEHIFEGALQGTIAKEMKGTDGFGYDPLFIPNEYSKTLAELGVAEKNRLSHRAIAMAKLLSALKDQIISS